MIEWIELSIESQEVCNHFLERFLTDIGVPNKYESVTADPSTFRDVFEECLEKKKYIRIGRGLGTLASQYFDCLPSDVSLIGTVDTLFYENGRWWPRNYYSEALMRVWSRSISIVNSRGAGLILGSGGKARSVVAAMSKLGITRILVADIDESRSQGLTSELKKKFFGIDFETIKIEELTMLPGICSMVVNTTPLFKDNKILQELFYFNFLLPQGIVMDVVPCPPETPLLREASSIGAQCVSGSMVRAEFDRVWVEKILHRSLSSDFTDKFVAAMGKVSLGAQN